MGRRAMTMTGDVPLGNIMRTEYIYSDDHLLGALDRYRELWTYPAASDRGQAALHAQMEALAARGLVKLVGETETRMRWRSAV